MQMRAIAVAALLAVTLSSDPEAGEDCGPAGRCGLNASCVPNCGESICSSVSCSCHPGFNGDGYHCTPAVHTQSSVSCDYLPLMVEATSSASMLLYSTEANASAACGAKPIMEVLLQHVGGDWQHLPQVGRHGEALPLELCGTRCPIGCRVMVRTRGGWLHNVSASDGGEWTTTMEPAVSAPHPPGHRLEILLKPPLLPPFAGAGRAFVDALIADLDAPHFVMRAHRLRLADVSTTVQPPPLSQNARARTAPASKVTARAERTAPLANLRAPSC